MASILLFDDIHILRFRIKSHLQKYGYTAIHEASNYPDTIQQYLNTKPDLVFISINENSQHSIDALKKLMEIDAKAKVLVAAPQGEEKLIMQSLKEGAKGYIIKPITYANLKQSISKLLT